MVKIIAWNVNGIRSLIKNDNLFDLLEEEKPSIICFGETKISCPFVNLEEELKTKIKGYKYRYWSPCLRKKGYSGTAIFSKKKPNKVTIGMKYKNEEYDEEGRVITLEFDDFCLLHVYTPNSGQALQRLKYRTETWDPIFSKYIQSLNKKNKNLIVCGDLNVAHHEIDIHSPKTNLKSAGYTIEERNSFDRILKETKLIDSYRYLHPEKVEYSYWTYMRRARENNKGWRIDYFLVSKSLIDSIKKSKILTNIYGSDHAPVLIKF
jgi:exodeoxyribonuclease III